MLFCINVEFIGLKLQTHFSHDVLFIRCGIFPQVICLHFTKRVFYRYISMTFRTTKNKTDNKYEKYKLWTKQDTELK